MGKMHRTQYLKALSWSNWIDLRSFNTFAVEIIGNNTIPIEIPIKVNGR